MARPGWDERIARARVLAETYSFAAEALGFYREIALFQKGLYNYLDSCSYSLTAKSTGPPEELDFFLLLPRFQPLCYLVESVGPAPLAESAKALANAGPESWEKLLRSYWQTSAVAADGPLSTSDAESVAHDEFFARACLQPYAEYLAERSDFPRRNRVWSLCPFCGRKPALGVLRPEGDGAKRSLICSLCSTEWEYRRILCPACGEEGVDQLPIYTAAEFEYVRVEACDRCKTYIKTVDLSKNGHAVPLVDELATVPLTLWAEEKGYTKLYPNLLAV